MAVMSMPMKLDTQYPCRPLAPAASPRLGKPVVVSLHRDAAPLPAPQYRLIPAGSELYAQGEVNDEVFTIIEGWVFLHHILEDGRRQILDFMLPGDICGELAPRAEEASHTAEALSDVTVAVLPRAQLATMFTRDPAYGMAFVTRMAGSLNSAYDSLIDSGRRTAIEAVAHLLLRLDERVRALGDGPDQPEIDFPLTQEHMGDALGLTAVHVCRTLRVLREKKIVRIARMRLRVDDRRRLAAIAGMEAEEDFAPMVRLPRTPQRDAQIAASA